MDPYDFPLEWNATDENTCKRHVGDIWLRRAIDEASDPELACSYCGKPNAAPVDELLRAFWAGALRVWEDANGALFLDSESDMGYAGETVDGQDLVAVEYAELWLNEDLAETLRQASNIDISYCRRDMWRLQRNKYLRRGWEAFVDHVKYRTRYVYWALPPNSTLDPDVMQPGQILEQISSTLLSLGAVKWCPPATTLFRALPDDPRESVWNAKRLGTAPREMALGNNRFNPHGIPMFYGSDLAETAIGEARNMTGGGYRVAEFRTTAGFHYVDLTAVPRGITEFHPRLGELHFDLIFLDRFVKQVSRPASSGSPDLDYVPTQVVAEWFMRTGRLQRPIAGIYYSSSTDQQGCWVIDVDNDHCIDSPLPSPAVELEMELLSSHAEAR